MSGTPGTSHLISIAAIEFYAALFACLLAFGWPRLGNRWFHRAEKIFARVAQSKGLAAAGVGLSVIVLRVAMLPLYPVPLPFDPDDFSTLLAMDTFAHGRLTNPTPVMWTHFETIHISMLPTYQSMYFPGQALLLFAGKVFFGNPWFGQLLVSAFMCAALCWMLQAWLPANWALLGGGIAALRLGIFSYWINTYHATGSLSALGGALILGGLPRLMRTGQVRYALPLGIGAAILVLTRPYEGLLLCLPVVVALARWMWKGKNRPSGRKTLELIAAPLAIVLAACAWLGYYDYRAFGNPLTPPYAVDRAQYAIAPYFIWEHPRPEPVYRHAAIRSFYENGEMVFYRLIHSPRGFVPYTLGKAAFNLHFYAGSLLLIPLIMIRRTFLDRRIRFLTICMLVLIAGLLIEVFSLPHYVAPFTAVFYAIGLQAMRHLRVWKPQGKPVGLAMARLSVTFCVLLGGVRLFAQPLRIAPTVYPPSEWLFSWFGPEHVGVERARVEARLDQLPGKQLVIVHDAADYDSRNEWVFNHADIDDSKVIWARDMGPEKNLELIRYYRDRHVWLVEPAVDPTRISAYPSEEPK